MCEKALVASIFASSKIMRTGLTMVFELFIQGVSKKLFDV